MIKLIASDMDGTLLNDDHMISEENLKAIRKAQEMGRHFTIVTGRDYGAVKSYLEECNLKCECILSNGAEYRDVNGNVIESVYMNKDSVKIVFDILNDAGLCIQLMTNKGSYVTNKESDKKAIASIGLKYVSISSVLFGFIMLFFYITGIWSDINGLEGYIFSYYISYVINQFFIQFAKGLEKVKNMGVAGVLSTIVTIIANLFFLLVIKWGLIGFFLANILAQIVSAIYLFFKTEIYRNKKTTYCTSKRNAYLFCTIDCNCCWLVGE